MRELVRFSTPVRRIEYKKQGIMTFRDHGHVSPMSGTMAPEHHTKWVDALDDSLESYLQTE